MFGTNSFVVIFVEFLLAGCPMCVKGNLMSSSVMCGTSATAVPSQCGDDFLNASLCLSCGCCFSDPDSLSASDLPPCYIPPGSDSDFQPASECIRSLNSLLGQVLLLNDGPSEPARPVTFYAMVEQYSPRLQVSLTTPGADGESKLPAFSRNTTGLSDEVRNQLQGLESNERRFYISYVTVAYPVPGIYGAVLMIQSGNGQDSLTIESKVSVEIASDVPVTSALQSAVFLNEGPYFVGQESLLVVILPNIDPKLKLIVNFGDKFKPMERGSLSFLLGGYTPEQGYSCLLTHRYSTGGEYVAKATLIYPKSSEINHQEVRKTMVRIKCSFPVIDITGVSPSKETARQIAQNETLIIDIRIVQNCSEYPVAIEWSVSLVHPEDENASEIVTSDQKESSIMKIEILPYSHHFGLYYMDIRAKIPYHNTRNYLVFSEVVWFKVVSLPLHAEIAGPTVAGTWENVTFDASKSFDPDMSPSAGHSALSYTWYCFAGQWEEMRAQEIVKMSFEGFEGCIYHGCACQQVAVSHSPLMKWPHEDLFRQTIPAMYTVALRLISGNRTAFTARHLMFYVDELHEQTTVQWTAPMHLIQNVPDIDIVCLSNCLDFMDHLKTFVLYVRCGKCLPQEPLTYEWTFQPANVNCTMQKIDWDNDTLTGNRKPNLIIPERTFENITEDESYQFFVTVTRLSGKQAIAGFSFYFAKYNTGFAIGEMRENGAFGDEQHRLRRTLVLLLAMVTVVIL